MQHRREKIIKHKINDTEKKNCSKMIPNNIFLIYFAFGTKGKRKSSRLARFDPA